MAQKKIAEPMDGSEQNSEAKRDPFTRFKFDEAIPMLSQGGRLAKNLMLLFLVFGFFNLQRAFGCDGWGDWLMVWAGLLVVWVIADAGITIAATQPFFQEGDRLKRYMLARFAQLIRIEIAVLGLAVICYAGARLF